MYNSKSILAIVPARAGSKGIPNKNIVELGGEPLIAHTIKSALNSSYLDKIVVSTDSSEIASISSKYNSDVVMRPSSLALDTSKSEDAVIHVLSCFKQKYDYIILLEPTSPFRSSKLIDNCIVKLLDTNYSSLLTVREDYSSFGVSEGNLFIPLYPNAPRRRQDREPLLCESSTIYLCKVAHMLKYASFISSSWLYYKVNYPDALDINNYSDLEYCRFIFSKTNSSDFPFL